MGLDSVELVMAVEEHFKIAISDADAVRCVTPAILIDVVLAKLAEPAPEPASAHVWTREEVAQAIKHIVIKQLGIKETRYREDARFVEDFGVD